MGYLLMKQFVFAIIILATVPLAASASAPCDGYTVRPGDNLTRIANREGGTVAEWATVNSLPNANLIRVGQCLQRPGRPGLIGPPVASGPVKGVALVDWGHMEDLAALNASFYFGWGEYCPADDTRCINMVRAWELPRSCYSTLLVGNEPNAVEPWGAPKSPADAATATLAIERQCPGTRLIVGNVSADDWGPWGGMSGREWVRQFAAAYKAQAGKKFGGVIGVHCYTTGQTAWCVNQLNSIRSVWSGAWALTEFNVLNGDASQMVAWMDYVRGAGFERVSVYTNRQFGEGYDLPGASVVNDDGSLTPIGAVYAAGW